MSEAAQGCVQYLVQELERFSSGMQSPAARGQPAIRTSQDVLVLHPRLLVAKAIVNDG